jgi:hypothetical protein
MIEKGPNIRDYILNKYTALAAGIIAFVGIKLGFNNEQKTELKEKVHKTLQLKNLPDNPDSEELRDIVEEAAAKINEQNIKKAKKDEEEGNPDNSGGVVAGDDDGDDEPPEGLEGEALKNYYIKLHGPVTKQRIMPFDDDDYAIYTHQDGFEWEENITVPPEPTVGDDNIGSIKKDFANYLPNAKVDIWDNNHIHVAMNVDGVPKEIFTNVEVLEDGTYQWQGILPYHEGGFYKDTASLKIAIDEMIKKYKEDVEEDNKQEQQF